MLQALKRTMNNIEEKVNGLVTPDPLQRQEGGEHYKGMKIQPVEFVHANGIPYLEGCAIKYLCRHRAKGGVVDLLKAKHYIDLLIESQSVKGPKRSVTDKPVIPMHTNPWNEVDCRSSVESGLDMRCM